MKDSGMAADALAYSRVWLRFADPETERHFARRALIDSMNFIRIYLLAEVDAKEGILFYL